ncbi:hypothetical protein HOD08_00220 [bacterium]|jgi:chloramphenicol 3-O phosphotransferase|nr:hypothetical protein [bacterium]
MFIFLNGTSSSGKTSIARALQRLYPTPLLYSGIDAFFNMVPEKYVGRQDDARVGYFFQESQDEHGPITYMHSGSEGQKMHSAMAYYIRMFLEAGNDMVIDEVLVGGKEGLEWYRKALGTHAGYFIGVKCKLDEVQQRERKRTDRHQNHARPQFKVVHSHGLQYDVEVDTTELSPEAAARKIYNYVKKAPEPKIFKGACEGEECFNVNFDDGIFHFKGHPGSI